jgi:hypothetical protein
MNEQNLNELDKYWDYEHLHLSEARSMHADINKHINSLTVFVLGFMLTALQIRKEPIDAFDIILIMFICSFGIISLVAGLYSLIRQASMLNSVAHLYAQKAKKESPDYELPSRQKLREDTLQMMGFALLIFICLLLALKTAL